MWCRTKQPLSRLIHALNAAPGRQILWKINYPASRMISGSSIESLQRAFLDPTSPFHLREGEVGPASPDELPRTSIQSDITRPFSTIASTIVSTDAEVSEAAAEARAYALSQGHDPDSFLEQRVVWGDLDSFRHVNNTCYVRFIESSRIQWMFHLGQAAGGPSAASDIISGRGVGLILKSISVNFKRPVVYPDTLLISHRPHPVDPPSPTHFHNDALVYSYAQRAVVATSESVLVWYDYETLKKAPPSESMRIALEARMNSDHV